MSANDQAFPADFTRVPNLAGNDQMQRGLTKREYFAGLAMQSALNGAKASCEADIPLLFSRVAKYSVTAADALLAELAKQS